tara:strand:- start:3592 stop:3933 length:342 start_codon:yes stop_codon:yes gene_type:complete
MELLRRLLLGKDQYLFDNLKDHQKLAFARLVSEVVKADKNVLAKEFEDLPEIPRSYMANSGKLSIDEAIEILKSLNHEKREFICDELVEVMKSDSYSSEEEKAVVRNIISKLN